jgi:hypothetical protein
MLRLTHCNPRGHKNDINITRSQKGKKKNMCRLNSEDARYRSV